MEPTAHLRDIQELKRANSQSRWTLLIVSLIALLLVFKLMGKEQSVIVEPPTRAKAIGMTGDRMDAAYLEEMGLFIADQMLTNTPASVNVSHGVVLRWTHPELHGDLQQRMTAHAKRLAESNATTSFWPQQVAPDVDKQRVILLGQLETYVNGMRTSRENVAYRADFQTKGGRVMLKAWEEVPTDDPWLIKQMQAEERAEQRDKGKKK
jgi:type IV conjugative transfer system protein TraE